ncbi:hypothetical protein [Mycobacteroides abscessus]|nr:hypothetical protein [Mycobacteroides abscessus]EIU51680.1 hypothetical protein MA6G0125S_5416 [Mycobacteroides abscessus 6G-0125-S]EIU64200.1 hypothetical protein MA6G0728S_5317 [Mycobacteroides abscessus 6G-0728-S]EIU74771.1 hypothetical protein MA6G1108_5419 [Mycobacteroides abscessus 6G-1108]EIV03066.1 hypothetical protein MA6G0728R_5346 [Mycobacteroides abscessus 6G-0728-R]
MTLLANDGYQLGRGAGLRFAPRRGHPLLLRRHGAVAATQLQGRR